MDRMTLALLCGLGFALATVLVMSFAPARWDSPRQKQESMAAAFIVRFMSGFLIPLVDTGWPPVVNGIIIGLGLSLTPAVLTRRYPAILISGLVGGAIVGWIAG